jgi:hypothetical protein
LLLILIFTKGNCAARLRLALAFRVLCLSSSKLLPWPSSIRFLCAVAFPCVAIVQFDSLMVSFLTVLSVAVWMVPGCAGIYSCDHCMRLSVHEYDSFSSVYSPGWNCRTVSVQCYRTVTALCTRLKQIRLLSADHIFTKTGSYQLLIGAKLLGRMSQLTGSWFVFL